MTYKGLSQKNND